MTKEDLEKTHPLYAEYIGEWRFFASSYYGGKAYEDGNYLLQHPFESADNYARRKSIAYYYNYCAPLVDAYISFLYATPPRRSYGSLSTEVVPPRQPKTLFDSFWWDCDLEGQNFNQFMRRAVNSAAVYGRVSILVDRPAAKALTQAEAKARDLRPYCTLILPETFLDWEYERETNGRYVLKMAKISEGDRRYRIWYKDHWELWESPEKGREAKRIDEGLHALGRIPIVTLYNKRTDRRMLGISDLQDLARINKNIYYLCSDAKEIIENTAFPMLAMPYDATGQDVQNVGPRNIIQFDPEKANALPVWLEPPHSSLTEIREWIQQDAQEMARIAKMGGMRNTETSTQPWSGVSLEVQNQQLFASLVEKAHNAEQAELDILNFWCAWEGLKFDGDIRYPETFAVRDFTIALQNAISAGTTGIMSQTFERLRQKRIVDATLPDIEEADRDTIYREIDDGDLSAKQSGDERANVNEGDGNDSSAIQQDDGEVVV